MKPTIPKRLLDADQLLIWKAALGLCDQRELWPRSLARAIGMIEARDPELHKQYLEVKELYRKANKERRKASA